LRVSSSMTGAALFATPRCMSIARALLQLVLERRRPCYPVPTPIHATDRHHSEASKLCRLFACESAPVVQRPAWLVHLPLNVAEVLGLG